MKLLTLFSHNMTADQLADMKNMGATEAVSMPDNIKKLWGAIPADLANMSEVKDYLKPVIDWVKENSNEGDFVLVQGDFSATFVMVDVCKEMRLRPVLATTERNSVETEMPDGSVKKTLVFKHVRFRPYEY